MRRAVCALLAYLAAAAAVAAIDAERVERVLAQTPLIDGHNDLPWEIRARYWGDLSKIDLTLSTANLPVAADSVALMTDIPRLGMLVDLSHVSEETMRAALHAAEAPVMFSHSSARAMSPMRC